MDQKQMQALVQQAQQLQEKLQQTVIEASAGGGSVTIKMNGKKEVLAVKIDPEIVKSGDVEMLQDLVVAAVNEGNRKVDETLQSNLGGMLGGMLGGGLPF
ncbi:MAG: YbaB/EbfC family nucleoid-associated protein [Terriglobales bacterium]|jgi:DNA-binding YbaB/EbfC family protein